MGCNSTFWPNSDWSPRDVWEAIESVQGIRVEYGKLQKGPDFDEVTTFTMYRGNDRIGGGHCGSRGGSGPSGFYIYGTTNAEYLDVIRDAAKRLGGWLRPSDCQSEPSEAEWYRGYLCGSNGIAFHLRDAIKKGAMKHGSDWVGFVNRARAWEQEYRSTAESNAVPNSL